MVILLLSEDRWEERNTFLNFDLFECDKPIHHLLDYGIFNNRRHIIILIAVTVLLPVSRNIVV